MPSEHVASFENTQGTTFDLLIRPHVSEDLRCNDLLVRLVEAVVVAFPQSTQQAIEDSIVAAIADADGRLAQVNLIQISDDDIPSKAITTLNNNLLYQKLSVLSEPYLVMLFILIAFTYALLMRNKSTLAETVVK